MSIALLLSIALQQPAQPPRRDVADPGVIATDQRVTPAGVQSVFDGRVTGVRFSSPSTLWVLVPGSAFHLAWSDNRVVARGRFDGDEDTMASTETFVKPESVLARTAREMVEAHGGGAGPSEGMTICPVCGEPLPCASGRAPCAS